MITAVASIALTIVAAIGSALGGAVGAAIGTVLALLALAGGMAWLGRQSKNDGKDTTL